MLGLSNQHHSQIDFISIIRIFKIFSRRFGRTSSTRLPVAPSSGSKISIIGSRSFRINVLIGSIFPKITVSLRRHYAPTGILTFEAIAFYTNTSARYITGIIIWFLPWFQLFQHFASSSKSMSQINFDFGVLGITCRPRGSR